jgi:hypothetical protein
MYKIMEFILIHAPRGIIPPEVMARNIEQVKKLIAKPGDFVPGGKLITSYTATGKPLVVCIWDAPSAEAFLPLLRQLVMGGWGTDVFPAEKTAAYIENSEKALKGMKV